MEQLIPTNSTSLIKCRFVGDGFECEEDFTYYSPRYKKSVTVKRGFYSDGASGPARDIISNSWWVHDVLCRYGKWDDGTKVSNLEASMVLYDILWSESYKKTAVIWSVSTFLFGGGMARKNGLWRVK